MQQQHVGEPIVPEAHARAYELTAGATYLRLYRPRPAIRSGFMNTNGYTPNPARAATAVFRGMTRRDVRVAIARSFFEVRYP